MDNIRKKISSFFNENVEDKLFGEARPALRTTPGTIHYYADDVEIDIHDRIYDDVIEKVRSNLQIEFFDRPW